MVSIWKLILYPVAYNRQAAGVISNEEVLFQNMTTIFIKVLKCTKHAALLIADSTCYRAGRPSL